MSLIQVDSVRKYRNKNRLSVAISSANSTAVEAALQYVHDKAISLAPMKTGLLKNSIVYSINNGDIQGLNEGSGGDRVDKSRYEGVVKLNSIQFNQTFSKVSGNNKCTGFVGTFVSRSVAYGYDEYKSRQVKSGVSNDTFPYGLYVEASQPFMRPAVYSLVDSPIFKTEFNKVMKRDTEVALKSGIVRVGG